MTSPERSLWAAVMERAVMDLRERNPRIRAEARRWFTEKDTGFENVCAVFNLDPAAYRRKILEGSRLAA